MRHPGRTARRGPRRGIGQGLAVTELPDGLLAEMAGYELCPPFPDMIFRYKNSQGKVVFLRDAAALLQAVRDGAVTSETLLAVDNEREFQDAGLVVAYQQAAVEAARTPQRARPSAGPGRPRGVSRRGLWIGGAMVALVVMWVVARRKPPAIAAPAVDLAAAAPAPDPEMRAALRRVVTEFADSVALAQRRLEDWVLRQKFDQRLHGAALLAPASLRAVRLASEQYRSRLDTLLAEGSRLALRSGHQADSLEGMGGVRTGLLVATQNALDEWARDLATYATLERTIAFATDSLATFLLQRQQSFVLRDGQAVFLSRDDAAEVRSFERSIEDAAQSERRWAEEILRKNPGWLTALAPADRPAFRAPADQRSNQ